MERAVLLMGGIGLLVMGLSFLFRTGEWGIWIKNIEQRGSQASLIFGSINVLLGSFIVAFHPVWHGLPLLLTIIGLLALFKGCVYLLFPQWLPERLRYVRAHDKPLLLRVSGMVFVVISVLLLIEWYSGQM